MRKPIVALAALLLAAASPAEKRMIPFDEWASDRRTGEPFEVTFAGRGEPSPVTKKVCAYAEWVSGEWGDGTWPSFTIRTRTETALGLRDGGATVEVPSRRIRPHVAPGFVREVKPDDDAIPTALRDELLRETTPVHFAEYCLEAGRRYHAVLRDETYRLPPPRPGMPPRSGRTRVLVVSDRPFSKGAPQVELTPGFRGWTY